MITSIIFFFGIILVFLFWSFNFPLTIVLIVQNSKNLKPNHRILWISQFFFSIILYSCKSELSNDILLLFLSILLSFKLLNSNSLLFLLLFCELIWLILDLLLLKFFEIKLFFILLELFLLQSWSFFLVNWIFPII